MTMEILGSPFVPYDFPIPKYTPFPEIFRKKYDKCHIDYSSGLKPQENLLSLITAMNGRVNQHLSKANGESVFQEPMEKVYFKSQRRILINSAL